MNREALPKSYRGRHHRFPRSGDPAHSRGCSGVGDRHDAVRSVRCRACNGVQGSECQAASAQPRRGARALSAFSYMIDMTAAMLIAAVVVIGGVIATVLIMLDIVDRWP